MLKELCTVDYCNVDDESIYRFSLQKDNDKYVITGGGVGCDGDTELQGEGCFPLGLAMDAFYLHILSIDNNFEFVLNCDQKTAMKITRELNLRSCQMSMVDKRKILINFKTVY